VNVLGINYYAHESSAALIQEGRVTFAASEERFSRIKKDVAFPRRAIQAALDHGRLRIEDLDAIAFGWNRGGSTPLHTLGSALRGQLAWSPYWLADSGAAIPRELYRGNGRDALHWHFPASRGLRILHVDHHLAHALSAFCLSGYEEALVLVVDGRGARQATSLYHGRQGRLRLLRSIDWPNSLGAFYEAFTDLLGFERHSDEWKVMGLAAYGRPGVDLGDLLRVTPDGYRVATRTIVGRRWADLRAIERRFGPRRDPERLDQPDRDLAASVQAATEAAVEALVRGGIQATGCRRLCLAGGVALNSKANGRLLASGLVDELFVQPAATDDGTAVGAAIAACAARGILPAYPLPDVYLGPGFGQAEVESAIRAYKLRAFRVAEPELLAAALLAQGAIVGWFQGRMEFGPRALGNRSILADPRRPEMKDRVNECVKFREGWRPFAPSCLAEAAGDYFEGCAQAPYMTVTFDVRPARAAEIPAVTHVDGTARVQTVDRAVNPRYWRLIHEFARLTGVPVVMNTSFNLRGEPIVCTPKDAIRTFYSSGLDFLVMEESVIAKDATWDPGQLETSEPLLSARTG
jgi:carbamoyltransferase